MDENKTQQIKMQASNIDEKGNVLYLDEERLARKVLPYPRYKNKRNGLGIKNFILKKILYMNDKRWPFAKWLYGMFIKYSTWMKKGGVRAKIYKKGIKLSPDMEAHTGTFVLPIHEDITKESEKVVVPIEFVKASLKKAEYIAGMDSCLCRDGNDCKDFPHDIGCLFLGEAGRIAVKHNLGRQFTYEEACERVDKAAAHGLMAQAVWVEVEQLLWGIPNDNLDSFLEFCFCCPCCCIALRLARNATEKERHRFHPAGWTAVPDLTKCIGCGLCVKGENGCPVEAISIGEDKKVRINQETCVGCGICRTRCPKDVIRIKQTMPLRRDVHAYFDEEFNMDLRVFKEDETENG